MFRVRLFLKSTPATPAGANQDAPSSYSELVDADDNGLRHQVAVLKHQVGNSNVAEASADCGRLFPNEGLVIGTDGTISPRILGALGADGGPSVCHRNGPRLSSH